MLNLSHPDINAFTEENERILSIVAGQAAIALANVQLFDELHRMNEALEGTVTQRTSEVRQKAGQLAVINRIAKTVNAAIDPEEALAEITGQIHHMVSFDTFSIALVSSGNDRLRVLTIGPEGDRTQSQEVSLPTGNSISDLALGQGQGFVFSEADAWGPELTGSQAVAGGMVVPLVFQEQVRGLIILTRHTDEPYPETDVHLIEDLAEHIAAALEKSRLYKALVKMNEGLEEIVEARTRQLADSEVHYRTIFEQSGDGILLIDEAGDVEVNTASGTVRIGTVQRSLRLNAASGDAFIDEIGTDATCKVASGDVRIGRFSGTELRFKAMSGDLRVGIPPRRTVDLDLRSMSGEFRNHLSSASGLPSEKTVVISVTTVSGDLILQGA